MIRLFLLTLFCFSWSVAAEPMRIVSYSPGATQTLIDLNCSSQIVAVTKWCPLPDQHLASRDCDVFNPDLEKLLQKKPTLVILPRLANPLWADRCRQAGLNVLVLSPENKNSVYEDVRLIGEAVHQEKLASSLISTLEKPQHTKPTKKLLLIWDGMMAGENSYLAGPLENVGYYLPVSDVTWIKCDWEMIAKSNPDVILWINNNPVDGPITLSTDHLHDFEKLPAVREISAVKNKKVFSTNSGCNWLPSSSLLNACLKMNKLLADNDLEHYLTK
jgi:ABC-type Fe3+-hydroxamate transport system substrate-binding protein